MDPSAPSGSASGQTRSEADDRDRAAEVQDQGAEGRDQAADDRDRAAKQRDRAADERDLAADRNAGSGPADSFNYSARDRKEAASDRAGALEDRRRGVGNRYQAGEDRFAAGEDRFASAGDRDEALRDALNLAAILESSGIAIVGKSLDGVILSWSKGAQKLYGYAAHEVIGQSISILLPSDRSDELTEILSEIRRGQVIEPFETVRLTKNRRPIEVSLTIVPIMNSAGEVSGATTIVRDISDRRRQVKLASSQRRALEATRLKSVFLADMSHEIRTSMNGVIGLTGLLLRTELSDAQREYSDGIRASGNALLGIINNILDLSKIETGKLVLEVVDFDLVQLLGEVRALVAESARSSGLELDVYCEPGVITAVSGDVGRLRQILLNLISNAIKFTERGKVVLRVRTAGDPAEQKVVVRFEIVDTGPGIPPSDRDRLFEPYSQADASTTRRFGGTGLGLAICSRLAEAMGGSIGVDSTVGKGSTFWVNLPFERRPDGPAAATRVGLAEGDATGPGSDGSRGHLLVVDDNTINQTVAAGIVASLGYECDLAAGGKEALEALGRRSYDAVLMDCHMPGMDGFEATTEIRRREGHQSHTPIIAITAGAMAADRDPCRQAGMDDYISKPVTPEQIETVLARWIIDEAVQGPA